MLSKNKNLTLAGVIALVGASAATAGESATWCCSTFDGVRATQCKAMSTEDALCSKTVVSFVCEGNGFNSNNAALVCSPSASSTDPKVKDCRCVTVLYSSP